MKPQRENMIIAWLTAFARVWRREFRLVLSDNGVLLFFFFLTLAYPVVYTLIYNTETMRDLPIAVVDHSRTGASRELSRMLDATDAIQVYDYASNLADARRMVNEHQCYGVLEIPEDYARCIGAWRASRGYVLLRYGADDSLSLVYQCADRCTARRWH